MKNKRKKAILTGVLMVMLSVVSWSIIGFTQNKTEMLGLSFKAKSNKTNFVLGEAVKIDFAFLNQRETSVLVPNQGVETGGLKILISDNNTDYKEYFGYGWGRKRGKAIALASGQIQNYEVTILWNGKPNVSHLNEEAGNQVLKGKITTEYALPKPGVYFIKGLSYVGENATPIESESVQITIGEPVGDDLVVWNQIKGNREIALLMQVGEFDTGKDEEKAKLVRQVEQILEQYPNSVYSSYLKKNLEKFKLSEEKRQKFKENLKQ